MEHRFDIDARGIQGASGATVTVESGRARIVIAGYDSIQLTRIQTEELGRWLTTVAGSVVERSAST